MNKLILKKDLDYLAGMDTKTSENSLIYTLIDYKSLGKVLNKLDPDTKKLALKIWIGLDKQLNLPFKFKLAYNTLKKMSQEKDSIDTSKLESFRQDLYQASELMDIK